MFRLPEFRRLFRLTPTRQSVLADVDQELEFHLAMRIDELIRSGLSPEEARAEAVRRFGDVAGARETLASRDLATTRRRGVATWLADVARDIRFALRGLRRAPLFTVTALTVLGLGIGLTTAMVSVLDRLVLNPLPYPNADRLAVIWLASTAQDHDFRVTPNWDLFDAWRDVGSLEHLEGHQSRELMLESGESGEMVGARSVTPGLLPLLGARMAVGRGIAAGDTVVGAPRVAVISAGAWRRRFGGRADIVGQSFMLDGASVEVVGVLAPGFELTPVDRRAKAEVWLPIRRTDGNDIDPIALVRPGVTFERASRELIAAAEAASGADRKLLEEFKPVLLGASTLAGSALQQTLLILVAAVALVLLIACANVAALLLGRATARSREFGIRSALGAGRGRVARQIGTEAVVLGLGGAVLGVVTAWSLLAAARVIRPASLVHIDQIAIRPAMLGFAVGVALLSAIGFGMAPLWAVMRIRVAENLVGRARGADGRGTARIRGALVIGQLALSLVLLVGAGLLLKSFVLQTTLPRGFDERGLGHVWLSFPQKIFPTAARREELTRSLLERIRATPGVTVAAATGNGPIDFGVMRADFLVEGATSPPSEPIIFPVRAIGPEFLSALGLPLVAGRTVSPDTGRAEILIDEATASRYFAGGVAVGKRVAFDRERKSWSTVVGIVKDQRGLADGFGTAPLIYRAVDPGDATSFLVRSESSEVLGRIAASIRRFDPGIRIRGAASVSATLAARSAETRFVVALVLVFAVLAVGLAAVGLYGVIAFAVAQRAYEIGVRMALGAAPVDVRVMVLREGLVRVLAGGLIGGVGALGLVRLIRSMLYHTRPWDPMIFAAGLLVLVVVGLIAIWVPARRASRVDPLTTLRAE